MSSHGNSDSNFPHTRWTLVAQARDGGEKTVAGALSSLCSLYWRPVYAFFRRSGKTSHDAEDLTQGFFADLLNRDFLRNVGREKGRFRTFVLTSTKNYLAKDWRYKSAAKRGGGDFPLSLDFEDAERSFQLDPSDNLTPDLEFERRWVLTLLESVLQTVRTEYKRAGKVALFDELSSSLTNSSVQKPHAEIAKDLDMTEGAVKVAAHRLKKRYKEALKLEVSRTVESDEDVQSEIRYLMSVFSQR